MRECEAWVKLEAIRAEVSSLFLGVECAMRGNDIKRSTREVSEKRERNDDSWRDDRRGRETRDKGKGRCVGEGCEGGGGKCKSWNLRMQGAMASDGLFVFWMVDVLTWGLEKATSPLNGDISQPMQYLPGCHEAGNWEPTAIVLILGRASLEGHTWVHGAGQGLTLLDSAQVNVLPQKQTGLKENLSWVDIRENVTSPPAIARGMKESSRGKREGSVSKLLRLRRGDTLIWVPMGDIGRLHDLVRVRAEDVRAEDGGEGDDHSMEEGP
ncbi:hypothetical protein F5148DRAFT_1148624 [Russula earlei]|uniref:Uncharacterized protein n=1 Tax=Russula earlei TaxID=71964 RepID=A0ACC0UBU2_9AGAM|nr:hypothetical protein F5148DRAFT_1148624 [Russula earlei]